MTKKNKQHRQVTKIETGTVSMSRKDYDWFAAMTAEAIGFDLPDIDAGKGRVRMPLWLWKFLLAVIGAAVDYGGVTMRAGGDDCQTCCDDVCSGFGGCDFCFGSACICKDGDLFECGGGSV